MATTLGNFTSETQLSTAATSVVSSNTSETRFLGKVTLTNTSDSNVEVYLWRILTATTATTGSGGNWAYRATIPAGREVVVYSLQGQVLGPSMSLKGQAGTASVINIDISGTIET